MIGDKKNRKGFTLVELLVVLGIFSIVGVTLVNVFLLSLKAQRQASLRQDVVSDLRFNLESMARQVRTSEIDYSQAYDGDNNELGIIGDENQLHLIDQNGNTYYYFLDVADQEVKVSVNGQVSSLTDSNLIKVLSLLFYITPQTNPFVGDRCSIDSHCKVPTIGACTIDEGPSGFQAGFCRCTQNSDCDTNNCDASQGICLPFNQQPMVTIVLGFESVSSKPDERKRLFLQTSAVSRVYKR